jgi:hypothetical protein
MTTQTSDPGPDDRIAPADAERIDDEAAGDAAGGWTMPDLHWEYLIPKFKKMPTRGDSPFGILRSEDGH